MNKNMLLSKMKLYGDTSITLAEKINCSPQRFSAKLNEKNGAEFRKSEIQAIKDIYSLNSSEMVSIFFAPLVSKKDTEQINIYSQQTTKQFKEGILCLNTHGTLQQGFQMLNIGGVGSLTNNRHKKTCNICY